MDTSHATSRRYRPDGGGVVVSLLKRVRLIPRTLREDTRGWFLKVIDGKEEDLPRRTGEVYLTMAAPGQVRGNHYHQLASEWFTVVQGIAEVALVDTTTRERAEMTLASSSPVTLFVPPRVAHVFKNPADRMEPMLLVAYSDRLYDPSDTIRYNLL